MKEKIAQWLSMSEKYGNFSVWDSLDKTTQDNYRVRADRLIILLKEEIEKSLLTDEAITEALDKYADTGSVAWLHVSRSYGEEISEVIAQAQLDKVLKIVEI